MDQKQQNNPDPATRFNEDSADGAIGTKTLGLNFRYLLLVFMIMILGIIGWVTLYGLTTTVLLGLPEFNAISPYRFAWPQGLMYLLFGLLCGTLITLRAPSRGVLHTVVSTILFGLIWFRFEIIDYYAYFLLLFTAALSAALVSARWTRSS